MPSRPKVPPKRKFQTKQMVSALRKPKKVQPAETDAQEIMEHAGFVPGHAGYERIG